MRSVRIPASRLPSSTRFLSNSPAPMSRVNAMAISATTRPLPSRRPLALAVRVSPSRTAAVRSRGRRRSSGQMPQNTPTVIEIAAVNASTRASTAIVVARGSWLPARTTNAPTIQRAMRMPITPPAIESSKLSIVNCRARAPRPAPRAILIANSRRRARPAARSRLATFAQAMRRTRITAPIRIQSDERTSPTTTS